jgi:hypothetical protein
MTNTVVIGQKPVETDLQQDKSTGSDDLLVSWQELGTYLLLDTIP